MGERHSGGREALVVMTGLVALLTMSCGEGHQGPHMEMPFGPGAMPGPMGGAAFISVSPPGGMSGVATDAAITLRFSHPMSSLGNPLVDLHEGDLSGPLVPMSCSWSTDALTLSCRPEAPLRTRTRYTLHVGGGMTDASGRSIDWGQHGPSWGGQWASGGMMGASHGGAPWHALPPGWQHANGGYGMTFEFTTG